MADKDQVIVARIGAAHGIKGEVRVASYTANPADLVSYAPLAGPDGRAFKIDSARPLAATPTTLIIRFAGVADRNAAEALNGIELSVPRTALGSPAEDEYFHADLIGLTAVGPDGSPIGTVIAVQNYGAGDLIEVAPPRGNTILVPFTAATVPEVDIPGGRVVIAPPPGLLENAS